MRAFLPNRRSLLGSLTLSFILFLLAGCTPDRSEPPAPADINTLNIFFNNQSIHFFDSESDTSTELATFDAATEKFTKVIELNTNSNKQGYEFAAYASDDTIYLLDYDKDSVTRTHKLTEINAQLCGIAPSDLPSQYAYEDKHPSGRSIMHATEVILALTDHEAESDTACASENVHYESVSFDNLFDDDTRNDTVFERSLLANGTASAEVNIVEPTAVLIIDYGTGNTALTEEEIEAEQELPNDALFGHLYYEHESRNLNFKYTLDDIDFAWSTQFPESETGNSVSIWQASTSDVLIKQNENLFVIPVSKFFNIDDFDNDITVPIQNRIDALFSTPNQVFESDPGLITLNKSKRNDSFVIKTQNKLLYYPNPDDTNFIALPRSESADSLTKIKLDFDLTANNEVLVLKQDSETKQRLSIISTTSQEESTLVTTEGNELVADRVEFHILESTFFANTFNLDQNTTWQAHKFNKLNENYATETYENSRLLYLLNLHEPIDSLILISTNSNNPATSDIMEIPSLYDFDADIDSGRKQARNEDNILVDLSFGWFNSNISDLTSGTIINDLYSRLNFDANHETIDVKELYFFNPSQEIPDPSINEQSLTLLTRDSK
jgi:hypothetical protein